MTTVTYSIPNINCGHCIHTIQNELSELDGVVEVNADLTSRSARIVFNPPADEKTIKAFLAEINYPVAE